MKILKVQGAFHWGYWVRGIEVSKIQFSLRVPPPTTLIGALSLPLLKRLGDPGETLRGLYSPVINILEMVKWATFSLDGYGSYVEDVNTYIITHFQKRNKDEKTKIERRYLMKYRIGAVKTGKVYAPDSSFTILYFIEEDRAIEKFGKEWRKVLEASAYEISRVGSRESIVSIVHARIFDAIETDRIRIETKYYFPSRLATNLKGIYFMEKFWRGGYGKNDMGKLIEYIIPGTLNPVHSDKIRVDAKYGKIYMIDGEEVLSPV